MSNNDVSTADEQKEFEIRKGDIDNFNEREVMKSLGENHIKLCVRNIVCPTQRA